MALISQNLLSSDSLPKPLGENLAQLTKQEAPFRELGGFLMMESQIWPMEDEWMLGAMTTTCLLYGPTCTWGPNV